MLDRENWKIKNDKQRVNITCHLDKWRLLLIFLCCIIIFFYKLFEIIYVYMLFGDFSIWIDTFYKYHIIGCIIS